MHLDGHMDSPQLLDEDQMVALSNVAKSGPFIVDLTDAT